MIKLGLSTESLKVENPAGNVLIKYGFQSYPFGLGLQVTVKTSHSVTKDNAEKVSTEITTLFKVLSNLEQILKTSVKKALVAMGPDWIDEGTTEKDVAEGIQSVTVIGGLSDTIPSDLRKPTNCLILLNGETLWGGHGADILVENGAVKDVEIGGNLL